MTGYSCARVGIQTALLRRCSVFYYQRIKLCPAHHCSIGGSCHVTNDASAQKLIKKETELSINHLTPEIQLHLITPNCRLWHDRGDDSPFKDPFWAFYWPGGQVLTRYILDNPTEVSDRHVVDVGSGCGATSVACKMGGAKHVTANDIDPVALTAIGLNAGANGVSLELNSDDLIGQPSSLWEVVVLGDMFYDADFANTLFDWINRLLDEDKTIFIGDPGRASLKEFTANLPMKLVFKADLPETTMKENNGLTQAWVWKCTKSKRR